MSTSPSPRHHAASQATCSPEEPHKVLTVPPNRSILDVLESNGVEVESVCCEGVCGTCAVQVLEGTPDHRDVVFDDEMRASNKWITVCCSRSHTKRLKLALRSASR